MLKEQVGRASQAPPEEDATVMAAVRSQQMRGHFEFEQRARWVEEKHTLLTWCTSGARRL